MEYELLTRKKEKLDSFRPLSPALVSNLERWFLIELTYTSNAIEGNTLNRKETAAVVEKGVTIGGKSLVEHLEATNHVRALKKINDWVMSKTKKISESDILNIHDTILRGIDDDYSGRYRNIPVRISGSKVILPNAIKVPKLMFEFVAWLQSDKKIHPVELSAEAHYQLVSIHPFVDGNGRTARLLMNLILLQHGYPPALIRKRDRMKYINSLEQAQLGGSKEDYSQIIFDAVNRSLDIYLNAVTDNNQKEIESDAQKHLLRIGQIAKKSGESTSTIRYWTKEGLLVVADMMESGYQLYSDDMLLRIKKIRELQNQRFTLREIKEKLSSD